MEVQVAKRLLTVKEYYQMAEAGILKEDERVELINSSCGVQGSTFRVVQK